MAGGLYLHIEEDEVEDYLLERSERFRGMLARAARSRKGTVTLESYRRRSRA